MDEIPFYHELAEGYHRYRLIAHIPTELFEPLLSCNLPASVEEKCNLHMQECEECREHFDLFKDFMGIVSASDAEVSSSTTEETITEGEKHIIDPHISAPNNKKY